MIEIKQEFKLSASEAGSALWKRVEEYLAERLNLLRAQNDGGLDPTETATVRGRIAELKKTIGLGIPDQIIK